MPQSLVSGQAAVTVGYSAGGRITSKTGVGSYTYNAGSRPYAVTSAGGCSYGYDAGGRMTSRCGQTLEWYSYDLPKKLAAGTQSSEFSYGVHRDRYKQVRKTGSTTNATIWYVGGLFEVEVAGSTTTYRHFIQGRERVFAVLERVSTTNTLRYLHRDHQGSVTEITSASGSVQERLAFDAWGLRRNATTWAALANPFSGTQLTKRGYTGHEHLDTVELIHMNGRVQDPRLGRFISPDPIVQAPYHSQSLNRYSYVWNNPVSLVDPSGFQARRDNSALQNCANVYDCPGLSEGDTAYIVCLMDSQRCNTATTPRPPGMSAEEFREREERDSYGLLPDVEAARGGVRYKRRHSLGRHREYCCGGREACSCSGHWRCCRYCTVSQYDRESRG